MANCLIKNGIVVDGTGAPGFFGSVLVEGGRIKNVIPDGEGLPAAQTTINARGMVIAPGFIDMHSHADWVLPAKSQAALMRPFAEQGITTVVGGNCGISPGPMTPESIHHLERLASLCIAEPFDYQWKTLSEFLDRVDENHPLVNLAQLVGHASIRYATSKTLRGAMGQDDLKACLSLARQSLDEGACGLSFGLGYDPGMYSPPHEIEAFCRVAAEAGKPACVHLKAYSNISPAYPPYTLKPHNLRALKEMLDIAARTRAKLQISHFILIGKRTWPMMGKALGLVDEARARGVDVMIDAFPYTFGNTTIVAAFPGWFLARLPGAYTDPWARARLKIELGMGFRLVGFSFDDFMVMDTAVPGWKDLNGMKIKKIARKWKTSSFNAMLRLAEKSSGAALLLYSGYSGTPENEGPLEMVLSHESCLFETDAIVMATGHPNPASTGTFPRILGRYVREKKLMGLEDAVHRMTGASARRFGLTDTGVLAEGRAADIVVFDTAKITDTPPSGGKPAGRPRGVRHVFINGSHVISEGMAIEGARAGRVIRK